MRRPVVVTGVGVLTPLGDSAAALHAALLAGRSALAPGDLFAPREVAPHPVAALRDFDPARYLGDANFRPLDRTGQLAAAAAQLALTDAALDRETVALGEVALVLGTMYGSVRTIAEFDRRGLEAGPLYVKPFDFANSVINAAAGQTAIWHQLRGPSTTVATGAASGVQAIALAAEMVADGRTEVALAGGAEELSFESLVSFARAGLLAAPGVAPRPFAAAPTGFALGEGAAFLVLESKDGAAARGARVRATVLSHGAAFDARQGREGDSRAAAVARAVDAALAAAGLGPTDVDAVSVAASGGAGDRDEARGIAAALGEHAARVPVSAPKALLGESLGASGAVQAVALLAAMATGELPGVPGLEDAGDLPLAAARATPSRTEIAVALLDGVGLDGHCCVLLLGRAAAGEEERT